jgi:hypothetical protein
MIRRVKEWSHSAQRAVSIQAPVMLPLSRGRRKGLNTARAGWGLGLLVAVLMAGTGAALLQRLGRRWGASDAEAREPLPGDDLVADPMVQTTHAISIAAPPADVWPWLVQMGYGRAGWYTNDWWYRLIDQYLFHVHMPRVDRILPEQQHLVEGDVIPDGPPGTAYFTVVKLEHARTLALYSTTHGTVWLPQALREHPTRGVHAELGWVFVLREPVPGTSRLLLRTRASGGPALYRAIAQAFLPPADFFVARMLLRTIKRNVERAAAGRQRRDTAYGVERVVGAQQPEAAEAMS